jgi:hypothetical protein
VCRSSLGVGHYHFTERSERSEDFRFGAGAGMAIEHVGTELSLRYMIYERYVCTMQMSYGQRQSNDHSKLAQLCYYMTSL